MVSRVGRKIGSLKWAYLEAGAADELDPVAAAKGFDRRWERGGRAAPGGGLYEGFDGLERPAVVGREERRGGKRSGKGEDGRRHRGGKKCANGISGSCRERRFIQLNCLIWIKIHD